MRRGRSTFSNRGTALGHAVRRQTAARTGPSGSPCSPSSRRRGRAGTAARRVRADREAEGSARRQARLSRIGRARPSASRAIGRSLRPVGRRGCWPRREPSPKETSRRARAPSRSLTWPGRGQGSPRVTLRPAPRLLRCHLVPTPVYRHPCTLVVEAEAAPNPQLAAGNLIRSRELFDSGADARGDRKTVDHVKAGRERGGRLCPEPH